MPWELGFVDGLTGRVGIIPVSKTRADSFSGEEYLSLYPYVDQAPSKSSHHLALWINNSEHEYAKLKAWAQGEEIKKVE